MSVIEDIRERKRIEQELQEKSDVLATVTQALNTFLDKGDWSAASQQLLTFAIRQTESEYGLLGVVLEGPVLRVLAHQGLVWDSKVNRELYEKIVRQYESERYFEVRHEHNLLGEVITNHSDDAKLEVSTSLQTFGLLVTAEPYFAVTKPGPVVVMENVLRPDTVGTVEQVSAKYELLPRAETYTVNLPPAGASSGGNGAMVSQREYEAVLALYQARNAIQIAKAEGVGARGQDTLAKAERLAQEAEQIRDRKNNSERVIMLARQAVQTAEDARNIAAHERVVSSGGQ